MPAHTEYKLEIAAELIGKRADAALASHILNLSRSKIKSLIQNGKLYINNQQIMDNDYRVKLGDVLILLQEPVHKNSGLIPRKISLDIVYEDEFLLVLNKQPGLTVHPGAGNYQDTLVNGLLHYLGHNIAKASSERPGIVHRLDKDTSGLMIVAKQEHVHALLSSMLAHRQIKRKYVALVYGVPSPAAGSITTHIARSQQDRTKMAVHTDRGKLAITHYKVEQIYAGVISKVICTLQTGRTHQIRVHLTHKHLPIIGDQVYGRGYNHNLNALDEQTRDLVRSMRRQALHAQRLEFTHPITGEEMEFFAPLPADMQALIEALSRT